MNNPYRVIKWLAFVTGFCIVSCTTALAQQSVFLFLQSESLQPFYVQIGDKVYSSSSIGHVIISGLQDNTCNFEVGFPQRSTHTERFSIPLNNKDHGYKLVQKGSANWALYDWQTKETIEPLKGSGNSAASLLYGERKKDDAFANLMAAVVNDSSVLYTSIVKKDVETVPEVAKTTEPVAKEKEPVAKPEENPAVTTTPVDTASMEKKTETVTTVSPPATDTAKLVKTERVVHDTATITEKITTEPAKDTALVAKYDPKERPLSKKPVKESNVVKVQEQTKNGETKMVFVDSSQSPADVVTVYITENKPDPSTSAATQPVTPVPTGNTQKDTLQAVAKKEEEKPAATTTPAPAKQEPVEPVKKDKTPSNTALTKEEIAEKIRQETWAQPEKKSTGDTLTIILESRQMKKDTAAKTEPLYRPKQASKQEPVKPATVQLTTPAKQDAGNTINPQTDKPVNEEKTFAKSEPAKPLPTDTVAKTTAEPVAENKEAEGSASKQQTPKAVYEPKPAVDTVKKTTEPVTTAKAAEPEKKAESGSKLIMINSDCVRFATDHDVDKLRVKMLAEKDSQKRVAVANKAFKSMCLYARQIKALSELFPTDETKYNFLQVAYPFAADTANFKLLYNLFTDVNYQNKFKTMVHYQ